MKTKLILSAGLLISAIACINAQPTAFTYQGRLNDATGPVNGYYDFNFTIFDTPTGGAALYGSRQTGYIPVTNGLFTLTWDFGDQFPGADRWLEIEVKTNSAALFTKLTPRQQFTATPYAVHAAVASKVNGMIVSSNISSTAFGLNTTASGNTSTAMGYQTTASGSSSTAMGQNTIASGDSATAMGSATTASGTYSTAMGYLTKASGFASTAAGSYGWATNDNSFVWADGSSGAPFTSGGANQFLIRATGGVGINTNKPNGAALAVNGDMTVTGNFKGGYPGNIISNGVAGGFIGGGGDSTFPNMVGGNFATVVGGRNNTASGLESTAMGSGSKATASYSTAMGASTTASGSYSTAMGGATTASGQNSTAMGSGTSASGHASTAIGDSTVASAESSTAMGNHTIASGPYSTAMGADTKASASYSTAMGCLAQATNLGTFVWADASSFTTFTSTSSNQFLIRATGGVAINTNNPNGAALAVNGNVTMNGAASVNGDMTVTGNFKGGYPGNIISNGVVGAFIGGGGSINIPNTVGADYATVVGGVNNRALGLYSTAMGQTTKASGYASAAMGGLTTASGHYSTAMGASATAGGFASTAMGGFTTASGDSSTAMGERSVASGFASTAMGAFTTASGEDSTAIGRSTTASGTYSTAMGYGARALHDGTFVWADSSAAVPFTSTDTNQFLVHATGGVGINTNNPNGAALAVNGDMSVTGNLRGNYSFGSTTRQMLNLWSTNYGIGVQASSLYFRCNTGGNDGFIWYKGGTHNDGYVNAGGGVELMHLIQGALYVNGTLASTSDRNAKENFAPVNPADVLEKVVSLPITRWNYKNDTTTPHLGPVAQDFYAAFGVGPDDKHITTVDESGVALAAIQGLNQKVESGRQEAGDRIQKLEAENAELKARLERLERLFKPSSAGRE